MYLARLKKLPAGVQMLIFSDADRAVTDELAKEFRLSDEQVAFLTKVYLGLLVGEKVVLDVASELGKLPNPSMVDIAGLARSFAIKKMWPLQEYLKNVDVLITRLGGRVPALIPLPQVETEGGGIAEEWTPGMAKEMLLRYKQYNEYYLTQKPIKDAEDRLKAPSVANWLSDYLHTMGAQGASALKRSQYLTKGQNTNKLNEAEKKNLLNFLLSYEEDATMYWRVTEEQYLLVEPDLPQQQKEARAREESTQQMADLVAYYHDIQSNYKKLVDEKKKGLESEINGNTKKLADIVWDALGLAETDRCLAALDLMIDHHTLADTLKTDQRLKSIVARYVGVHYGNDAKNYWNMDLTTSVGFSLFWRVILVEKIQLGETKAAIIGDYFSKKMEQKTSPMYLDLKLGKFLFREVAYKNRQLSFA